MTRYTSAAGLAKGFGIGPDVPVILTGTAKDRPLERWWSLGAQRRDVLSLVVGHALKLVGIGTAAGLVLAFFSTRALAALLYSVGALDLTTFGIVAIVLAAIALLASYVPAVRATRADPMIALSHNA